MNTDPDRLYSVTEYAEDDENWPALAMKPTNNKAGPKRVVSLEKALKPRKYRKAMEMIDETKPLNNISLGYPQTKVIAGVTKTRTVKISDAEEIKEVMIAPVAAARTSMCQIKCHVTDATSVLASVRKMTQHGNRVIFDEDRSFIQSKKTGLEMDMISEHGVYKLDVIFMNGEKAERGRIVIDSGAADNVMPCNGLSEVPIQPREPGVNFTSANGKPMANHGRKDVQFIPYDFWEAEFGSPFVGQA